MSKSNVKPIKNVHDFKKKFMPETYRQELTEDMTSSDHVELTFRRAVRSQMGSAHVGKAKSKTVAKLEDLERKS